MTTLSLTTIGLDLAKSVFQVHGADDTGAAVLKKRLCRGWVAETLNHPSVVYSQT